VVQNLDLGRRGIPSRPLSSPPPPPSPRSNDSVEMNPPSFVAESERVDFTRRTHLIGLSDDDGVYPTREQREDDEISLESILSGNYDDHRAQRSISRADPRTVERHATDSDSRITKERRARRSQQNERHQNLSNTISTIDSTEEQTRRHLEELAEATYFNFLTDLMNSSRSRSLTASVEELAMHRIISERLYSYFTQPNQVKLIRNEMIEAAKDISPSTSSLSSNRKVGHRR
jgi:hypothetical protein